MSLFTIDQKKCAKDGICAAVCPMGLIRINENNIPEPIENAENLCISCGHCVAVCPNACFSHGILKTETFEPIKKEFNIGHEESIQFLRKRRSIRRYKEKEIPEDEIVNLIKTARYAPTGHNSQTARWHVISGKEKVNKIASLVIKWAKWLIENEPEFATQMGFEGFVKKWEGGEDAVLRGAPALIIAHTNENDLYGPKTCTIALTYLELAATSMGLGTCWAGFLQLAAKSYEPLRKALGLPDGHILQGGMMVGYPKFKYVSLPTRKEPVITWGK